MRRQVNSEGVPNSALQNGGKRKKKKQQHFTVVTLLPNPIRKVSIWGHPPSKPLSCDQQYSGKALNYTSWFWKISFHLTNSGNWKQFSQTVIYSLIFFLAILPLPNLTIHHHSALPPILPYTDDVIDYHTLHLFFFSGHWPLLTCLSHLISG